VFSKKTDDNESDVDGHSLVDELKTLANILPENIESTVDELRYLSYNMLPHRSISLRMLLTISITLASGEACFLDSQAHKNLLQINDVARKIVLVFSTVNRKRSCSVS